MHKGHGKKNGVGEGGGGLNTGYFSVAYLRASTRFFSLVSCD